MRSDRSLAVLFRLLAAVAPRVPRSAGLLAAEAFGQLIYRLNRPSQRAVWANLAIVTGQSSSLDRLARQVFVTATQNYFDLFALPALSTTECAQLIDVSGWEHLEAAQRAGRGVVAAAAHLGNIEIVARLARLHGLVITVPVEVVEPPELLNLLVATRERNGFRCLPVGSAFQPITEALRRNEIVTIACDRNPIGQGLALPFFGHPTQMPTAAALLALRTGAALLTGRSARLPGGRFRVEIGAPINVARAGRLRDDVPRTARAILGRLEEYIRATPGQWLMFQPLWSED